MLVHPSAIDLSSSHLRFLAGHLQRRRRERGTQWRRLPVHRQALLVLAHLRCGDTYARLAASFGIGVDTSYRYIREAVDLLAALAPKWQARRIAFVLLDGTLPPIDRIATDHPYHSEKHRKHGMNVQVLADPLGRLLRASPALPGAVLLGSVGESLRRPAGGQPLTHPHPGRRGTGQRSPEGLPSPAQAPVQHHPDHQPGQGRDGPSRRHHDRKLKRAHCVETGKLNLMSPKNGDVLPWPRDPKLSVTGCRFLGVDIHKAAPVALLENTTDPRVLEDITSLKFLDERDSVAVAVAASEGIARLETIRFRALAQLSRHRDGARSVTQEVAFALSLVDSHAGEMVAAAAALTTRLPRTLNLMDQGKVSGFGAMKAAAATAWLSDENALAADALLEERLPGKNSEQIRKAASHAAATVDQDGADKRAEHHRDGRRLSMRQGETGVASIEIEDGPVEKVTAAYRRIDREARALKTGDETRTLDQLRADVALDLLLGGQGGVSERTEVFLYMDLSTYLGLNDDPVELAAHGHLPAALARHIATRPNTVLRRIITDPLSGQVLDLGRDRYRPTAGLDEYVRVRDRECRRPGCHRPAQACDLDHTVPWQFGGHTTAADLISFCRRDHRLKDEPGWTYHHTPDGTLTITTPTGQTYNSTPPPLHQPRTTTPLTDTPPPF